MDWHSHVHIWTYAPENQFDVHTSIICYLREVNGKKGGGGERKQQQNIMTKTNRT